MKNFVLWSIVALQLIQLTTIPCAATQRGSGRGGGNGGGSGRTGRPGELRVRFGVDDVDDEYPYVVSIRVGSSRICTGTLITPDWVLTAAHCSGGTHIRFGNMTIKGRYKKYFRKIKKMIIHPRTQFVDIPDDKIDNDIALLQIEPLHLKKYGRISALNYRSLIGYPVEYAGFGATSTDSDENHIQISKEDALRPLQLGTGVVVQCDNFVFLNKPNLCIAPKCSNNEQDTLPGDSGGPLFYGEKVVGALCGGVTSPIGSYTPVSPYLDWIHDTMTQDKI